MNFTPSRTVVPFDWAASKSVPDWRDGFMWPTDPRSSGPLAVRQFEGIMAIVGDLDPFWRAVVSAASGPLGGFCLVTAEGALAVQAASALGIELAGGPPAVRYLSGASTAAPRAPMQRPAKWSRPKMSGLRHLRVSWRIGGWSSLVAGRDATTVVSRNRLQDRWASSYHRQLKFRYPQEIIASATRRHVAPRTDPPEIDELTTRLVDAFVSPANLRPEFHARCQTLITQIVRENVLGAYHDLSACQADAKFPLDIWSGSAGYYPSRVVGLASMLKGGSATRFDHGGPSLLASSNSFAHAMVEGIASTACVLPSKRLAKAAQWHWNKIGGARQRSIEFSSGGGDRDYQSLPPREGHGIRRRVLYPATLLSGFWQYSLPDLPDVVNLDWQLRFSTMLAEMPIDLICKPHPEGMLAGKNNPLEQVAEVSYASFEEHIATTDVFVFDLMGSTTFWKALCTDRSVVYIDLGMNRFNELFEEVIARRCHIVQARYDSRNIPVIDAEELQAAICEVPDKGDPSEILEIIGAGEAPEDIS